MAGDDGMVPAVVVTGVSSGIGAAVADRLLTAGYRVFGSVRREEDALPLVRSWGHRFTPIVFDVTDELGQQAAVAQVERMLDGRGLRALVNNAGISYSGPISHQSMEEIRQVFEVNVFGVIAVTRAFLPLLRPAGKAGRIVNIGSVSGSITVPFMGAYSASKHALEALSQAFRRELTPTGIKVTTIEPGFVRSRMFEKSSPSTAAERYAEFEIGPAWKLFNASLLEQEKKAAPAALVAAAVLKAIESGSPRTRHPLDPLWWVGRLLPDRTFDKLIFNALGIQRLMRPR